MHWRRQWHPTPVLLPGKSHGWRSLVGCSPWGRWELDTTERLHFLFSLSCIGEGNGSPLQCSCLENPRDGGAWWAAVCGVAQSRTRLKQPSSSSSSISSYVFKSFTVLLWYLYLSEHLDGVWHGMERDRVFQKRIDSVDSGLRCHAPILLSYLSLAGLRV